MKWGSSITCKFCGQSWHPLAAIMAYRQDALPACCRRWAGDLVRVQDELDQAEREVSERAAARAAWKEKKRRERAARLQGRRKPHDPEEIWREKLLLMRDREERNPPRL